jgi:hypothetical protein
MPDQIFDISSPDLKKLKKFFKQAPRQFQFAAAGVLNDQAFGTRREAVQKIGRNMIVRNPKFVNSMVRFKKANGRQDISLQQSETGSMKRKGFSGWIEQETGKRTQRTRTQTLLARGGSRQNIVKRGFRMRPGLKFTDPDDFSDLVGNPEHRTIAMLVMLRRNKFKKPFILPSNRRGKKGLYKFQRGKVKRLQDLEPSNPQPKRKPWLIPGRNQYFQKTDQNIVWRKQLKRQSKHIRKGKL